MGTDLGKVYILDFNGNQNQKFEHHTSGISEICIDSTQEYIATCSSEGKVVIRGLFSNELYAYQYGRPILAFAFDPNYAKTKQFVCGGRAGELLLNTKGFLGLGNKNVKNYFLFYFIYFIFLFFIFIFNFFYYYLFYLFFYCIYFFYFI